MTVTDELSELVGARQKTANRKKVMETVADLIQKSKIDLDDIGGIDKITIGTYQALTKDADGEAHIHDMERAAVVLSPKWADGPEWPVVQPAKPTIIKPPKAKRTAPAFTRTWKTAVILPDPQIGFRRVGDELDPFHDVAAIDAALGVLAEVRPDRIVNLGDTLDLPEWGKYLKEPGFYFTTQPTIEYGHEYLARQRAAAPEAEIDLLEGNHDFRMTRGITENALAAFGLRQAATPESWPVMSVPHLLRLDDLNVTYHAGYPAGQVWINDNLRCIHGIKVRSGGSTASAVVNDESVSTIFGHVHRLELQHKTRHTRNGPLRMYAATPGCLCRTDGSVPSVKSGTDLLGRPLTTWENWQQGLAVVHYVDGDGPHSIELVEIQDGAAHFRGSQISA